MLASCCSNSIIYPMPSPVWCGTAHSRHARPIVICNKVNRKSRGEIYSGCEGGRYLTVTNCDGLSNQLWRDGTQERDIYLLSESLPAWTLEVVWTRAQE